MSKAITTYSTAEQLPLHRTLKARATAALAAGCLVVSLCPAVALAAPANGQGQDQGGQPPAMQQGPGAGQMGEAPEGGFGGDMGGGPAGDFGGADGDMGGMPSGDFGGDVGGVPGGDFGQPGEMGEAPGGEAPELPEGEESGGEMPAAPEGQPSGGWGEQPEGGVPDGQAFDGEAPDGRQPAGEPGQMPRDDEFGDQIRQYLGDEYGLDSEMPAFAENGEGQPGQQPDGAQQPGGRIDVGQVSGFDDVQKTAQPGQSGQPGQAKASQAGKPAEAPELPEGAVNVQKLIDSARDAVTKFGADLESANYSDASFTSTLGEFIQNAAAQREQDFASGSQPGRAAESSQEGAAPNAGDGSAAPANASEANGAQAQTKLSDTAFGNLISYLMSLFGFTTSA